MRPALGEIDPVRAAAQRHERSAEHQLAVHPDAAVITYTEKRLNSP